MMKTNETYLLLLPNDHVEGMIEDWLARNLECNLTLRRAKTKGHTVVETNDVLFANRIQQWHGCRQVFIRKEERQ